MKWHLQPPSEAGAPSRTILFFTGWGMDPAATRHLDTGTCQVWTAWDYSSLAPLPTPPGTGECFLVAWSLGVWAATQMEWSAWPLKAALALNGTPHPRHPEWGIPPAIFDGTAQHWGEPRARQRFLARMTGSQDAAAAFPWGTATPAEQRRELPPPVPGGPPPPPPPLGPRPGGEPGPHLPPPGPEKRLGMGRRPHGGSAPAP